MKKTNIALFLIVLVSFAIALYYYPQMPEKMASHWDASGNVNGYMGRFWGLFLMPFISIGIILIFLIIPLIDPLKENIKKFRKYFDVFIVLITLFMLYIYKLTILWNLGYKFNMVIFLVPAFAVLFFYCGILIEKAKRNWSIGIRTPWTLSNEVVWQKTHKLGGELFKACAIISLLGLFLQKIAFVLIIAPIILVAIYLFVYSYLEFQKETRKEQKGKNKIRKR